MTHTLEQGFRNAMRQMAASVCVVTSHDDDEWGGITATSVTSVSMDPAAVLVCINHSASIHKHLGPGKRFCVNVLSSSQACHAGAFGGRLKGVERFAADAWQTDAQGLPFLKEAQSNLFCSVAQSTIFGTHSIFIGRLDDVRTTAATRPLIYHDGQFGIPAPLTCI